MCQRSAYAVDVLSPGLTKSIGAKFGLETLGSLGAQRVLVFGDSTSDLAMVEAARDTIKTHELIVDRANTRSYKKRTMPLM